MSTPTPNQIAALFGCTAKQVKAQYGRNARQLAQMADKAKSRASYRGYSEDELRQKAAQYKKLAN